MVFKNYSSFPLDWTCQALCQGRMFFGSRQKDFFSPIKWLKSYHILCFFLIWAMTFLYSCFILSEILITFLFLGSCALLFQLFPSSLSYFLFYVVPFFARALHSAKLWACWLLSRLRCSCHPRSSLHHSTGLVSLFLEFHVFFIDLFPVQAASKQGRW